MKTQEIDRSTLGWVRKELDETLNQAAQALQEYSEDKEDRTRLRFCATYLHQVYGTLQMLELFGISLLAEEMEHLIEAMLADSIAEPGDAEEALMTAILRVSELLERIQAGQNDSPLSVLAVVNDLRSVRGEKLLSEGALFFADAKSDQGLRRKRAPDANLAATAKRRRPRFQLGLLGLLRGKNTEQSLVELLSCLDHLDDASTDDRSGDLWWVTSGMVEGLSENALKAGAAVKGLLGQVDQQMRRVIRDGEQALIADPPRNLFSNLLYYVGQSGPVTERLQAIHDRFGLQELVDEAKDQEGRTYAPGSDILESVATAIREDITEVKESLDLFVRSSQKDGDRLKDADASLQRVADTLGMLGLNLPRNTIKSQVDLVRRMASGGEVDDTQLIDLAKSLLFVESSLDSLVSGGGKAQAADAASEDSSLEMPDDDAFFDMEYQSVFRTTVREAVADIGAVKDAIVHFIEREDHAALAEVEALNRRLHGALGMIGLDRASQLVEKIAAYLQDGVGKSGPVPDGETLDALADAITSLEYYLEGVLNNRLDRDTILDVAESSMIRLAVPSVVPELDQATTTDDATLLESLESAHDDAPDAGAEATTNEAAAEEPSEPEPRDVETPSEAPAQAGRSSTTGGINFDIPVKAEDLDDEILEIFLEEVDEVLEVLRECYPRWRKNNQDAAALATARRMFHTIKGSGRMAGAMLLGELGWSIERLLNRVIDGHVAPGADVYDVIERSLKAVPELANELVNNVPPLEDVRWIMNKADILAEPGRQQELAGLSKPSESGGASVTPTVQADPDDALDGLTPSLGNGDENADEAGKSDAFIGTDTDAPDDQIALIQDAYHDVYPEQDQGLEDASPDQEKADAFDFLELSSDLDDAGPEENTHGPQATKAVDHAEGTNSAEVEPPAIDFELLDEVDSAPLPTDADVIPSADGEAEQDTRDPGSGDDEQLQAPAETPVPHEADAVTDDEVMPVMDPVLYEIFSNETDDHLAVVSAFVQGCRDSANHCTPSDGLGRALHTLTGSARMADVAPVAKLGRRLEEMIDLRREQGCNLTGVETDLLASGVQRIRAVVDALGGTRRVPAINDLLDAISENNQHAAESADLVQSDQGGAAPGSEPASELESELESESEPALDSASLEPELGPESESGPQKQSEPESASEPEPEPEPNSANAPDDVAFSAEEKSDAQPLEEAAAEDKPEEPIDADLVDLFLEEAEDILLFMDSAIADWEEDSATEARINEIHRSLHTLKGGARLARFNAIGDLCHALESLTSDVESHKIPADDVFFNLLHVVMERLGEMVIHARQERPMGATADLIAAIQRLRGADTVKTGNSAASTKFDEEERDGDLVEIFLEEAAEILQVIESQEQMWADQPDEQEHLVEIQRALHTIKGGARMAGFPPIANLSHSMETLLNAVKDNTVPVDHRLFELLELSHDRLYMMRDRAKGALVIEEAHDLLADLETLRKGEPPPDDGGGGGSGGADKAQTSDDAHSASARVEQQVLETLSEQRNQPQLPTKQSASPAPSGSGAKIQSDQVRVRADQLDDFVNFAGEISIYRARLDQQVGAFRFNLTELDQTVFRLRDQLRTLEIETEKQIIYRHEREHEQAQKDGDFDPLELDRFSRMQELSRGLSESLSDLGSIQGLLDNLAKESETLLLQQSRVNSELQDGLMRTRMVPFANLAPRLRRIVRQTSQELGRKTQLKLQGAQGDMDRTVLERVTAPLEHMLRNAVAHGVEKADVRIAAGKPETGEIIVSLDREGADVVLRVQDDGAGLNLEAIRKKALDRGLLAEDAVLTDREIMQFVLEQGFSTAGEVTQIAGRGVGMDVVNSEIKQLGGTLEIDSETGKGTQFTIRLPFTLAMNQALLCSAGEQVYAIPLTSIVGVVRLTQDQLETYFSQEGAGRYHYGGVDYEVNSLTGLLGTGHSSLAGLGKRIPVVLVHAGDHRLALQMDALIGNREIVVKSVGSQISTVPGVFGATILADGRVVLILDIGSLARLGSAAERRLDYHPEEVGDSDGGTEADYQTSVSIQPLIMVVDDSITMRKVATRLLERNNMKVITAKDGVDAVTKLQEQVPDAMLLDIEMPRMDGYELATHMRNDERLAGVPIIMITSRTGEKHRQRAMNLGVNRYLGKPYQENELLENLRQLLDLSNERR